MKRIEFLRISSIFLIIFLTTSYACNSVFALYQTSIDFEGATIAFDLTHGGYHATIEDLTELSDNLTTAGNRVIFIEETWELTNEVDALFLTQSDDYFLVSEQTDIQDWFALGDKLLWVSGDSDYGGYYNQEPINQVLESVGAISRIDSTSISDPVCNDGASYRVAAPYIGVGDPLYDQFAQEVCTGMEAGILIHGPCAIIAYDGVNYKDLRYGHSIFPERIMTIMTYSENATAHDSDLSEGDLDLYAEAVGGLFPAVVYENMTNQGSHLIVSGEAIYTSYKFMYNQYTENGVYNFDLHYGQMLVNNILNYLMIDKGPFSKNTETFTPTSKNTFNIEYQGLLFSFSSIVIISVFLARRRRIEY